MLGNVDHYEDELYAAAVGSAGGSFHGRFADLKLGGRRIALLHSDDAVSPFLNLSPFLIDENALKGQQNSKLFFFRYNSENQYTYVLTDTLKDRLDLDAGLYEDLKQQFDTFFRNVL